MTYSSDATGKRADRDTGQNRGMTQVIPKPHVYKWSKQYATKHLQFIAL